MTTPNGTKDSAWHAGDDDFGIYTRNGRPVAEVCTNMREPQGTAYARQAFIVKACNAHDELVAALRNLITAHRKLAGPAETEAVDHAIAALAKAAK